MSSTDRFARRVADNPIISGVLILAAVGSLVGLGIAIGLALNSDQSESTTAETSLTMPAVDSSALNDAVEGDEPVATSSTTSAESSTTTTPQTTASTGTTTTTAKPLPLTLADLEVMRVEESRNISFGSGNVGDGIDVDVGSVGLLPADEDTLWCTSGFRAGEIEFRLDRLYSRFIATAGYSDDAETGISVSAIFMDENREVLADPKYSIGERSDLDLDVSNVTRLIIRCVATDYGGLAGVLNSTLTPK